MGGTRALVASTALTESNGGQLGVVNKAGYAGRYQAGADWLADAGYIKGGSAAVRAAMKADGYSNEYKWGLSGGMTRFLKNDANWNNGLTYDQYLGSAEVQGIAFKANSDKAYRQLVAEGVITPGTSQDRVASLLKARHIAGIGGARAAAAGLSGAADANGTTALRYYNDLAPGNPLITSYSGPSAMPVLPAPAIPSAPAVPAYGKSPEVQIPLGSRPESPPIKVQMPMADVGQDVRDRGVAHIVTGGLAQV